MKFKLIMLVDAGKDEFDREEIGEMTMTEIKEFEAMIVGCGETVEGFMFEELKFCIEEKAFYLYVA